MVYFMVKTTDERPASGFEFVMPGLMPKIRTNTNILYVLYSIVSQPVGYGSLVGRGALLVAGCQDFFILLKIIIS